MAERESWDHYLMRSATMPAERSTCLRRQVGCVIVRDKQVVSTGYNGAPRGFPHCDEIGCIRDEQNVRSGERTEVCYGSHAEQNALAQAARIGVSVLGSTLYCTNKPCSVCAKMLINAGVARVVFKNDYPDPMAEMFFEGSGIELVHLTD